MACLHDEVGEVTYQGEETCLGGPPHPSCPCLAGKLTLSARVPICHANVSRWGNCLAMHQQPLETTLRFQGWKITCICRHRLFSDHSWAGYLTYLGFPTFNSKNNPKDKVYSDYYILHSTVSVKVENNHLKLTSWEKISSRLVHNTTGIYVQYQYSINLLHLSIFNVNWFQFKSSITNKISCSSYL